MVVLLSFGLKGTRVFQNNLNVDSGQGKESYDLLCFHH